MNLYSIGDEMEVPKPLEWLKEVDKDLLEAFIKLRREAQTGKKLSNREKRLCLIAAYAALGCSECLKGAIMEAKKEGISLEESLEAASIAILSGSGRGVVTIWKAFKEILRSQGNTLGFL